MSKVQINNVVVHNNPAMFKSDFHFDITFDCMENLVDDLEWKLTYVGSAESQSYDQVLDTIYVGPVAEGRHMFTFQADPPNPDLIPKADIIGATVVLLTCSYHEQEFIRVGYFVNNEYESDELRENPPETPNISVIHRSIMADQPRVTRFKINWGDQASQEPTGEEMMNEDGELQQAVLDTDSMLEPLPSAFKDVHSMDETSNVEMEMAF
ncbi:histone chaperone ASF1A [Eurytemora carolleeae]|uniref:histone chaperone ASF1A n=1 Tax=Eurytemora carolleeae TaxID=1294199 RepID=UPI000C77CB6F|nr:histone chaperone ASF1A [Eurytemora carolleeae]|eukprot:XP_023328683.1 histone chaperone ASF1A-like [Eurytemora affinis]